jgi:hypothetical protein
MAWQSSYWSCSKFADWLRGTPKPEAETSKGWRLWREASEKEHPFRFWLAEEGLDHIQDFVTYPSRKVNDLMYYLNNRFVTKTHALTSHPRDIPRGEWRDVGNRFLPCLFNELVDFVEVEQAWHHSMWDDKARKEFKVPWTRRGFLRLRTWRCPEAGLSYLNWAKDLTNAEFLDEDKKHEAELTHQALAAREILELYHWWKEVYPKRLDPYDSSGWSAICERQRKEGRDLLDMEDRNETEREERNNSLDLLRKIEEEYEKEDEEMMIRLIKIRQSLWT